jgi:hypothetical protein
MPLMLGRVLDWAARMFTALAKEDLYVQRLKTILADEHKRSEQHKNSYELGA